MTLIKWDDSLSVGVKEIDLQHQKLFSMINELNDAMRQGKSREVMGKILAGLKNYTVTHFGVEERYFDRFGYPEADSHKREHTQFVEKLSEFEKGFQEGRLSVSLELMNFLNKWLRGHIKVVDKKYTNFFHEHGIN